MDTRWLRNSFVYLVIMVAVLAIFFTLFSPPAKESQIGISDLYALIVRDAKSNRVDEIVIQGGPDLRAFVADCLLEADGAAPGEA